MRVSRDETHQIECVSRPPAPPPPTGGAADGDRSRSGSTERPLHTGPQRPPSRPGLDRQRPTPGCRDHRARANSKFSVLYSSPLAVLRCNHCKIDSCGVRDINKALKTTTSACCCCGFSPLTGSCSAASHPAGCSVDCGTGASCPTTPTISKLIAPRSNPPPHRHQGGQCLPAYLPRGRVLSTAASHCTPMCHTAPPPRPACPHRHRRRSHPNYP